MKFFRLFSKITKSLQVSKLENSKKFYEITKSYDFEYDYEIEGKILLYIR